jgi:hypothetical protein
LRCATATERSAEVFCVASERMRTTSSAICRSAVTSVWLYWSTAAS